MQAGRKPAFTRQVVKGKSRRIRERQAPASKPKAGKSRKEPDTGPGTARFTPFSRANSRPRKRPHRRFDGLGCYQTRSKRGKARKARAARKTGLRAGGEPVPAVTPPARAARPAGSRARARWRCGRWARGRIRPRCRTRGAGFRKSPLHQKGLSQPYGRRAFRER